MAYNSYLSGSGSGSANANAVASPAHIKCKDCNIKKPKSAFSKKQLVDLATHMQRKSTFKPEIQGHVICIGCSPKQVVELHCHICDFDKGLDKFSKAQRKTPDTAICWSCAEERDNYEPGEQDGDESSGGSDFDESDASDDTYSIADTASNSVRSTLPATLSSRGGVSLPRGSGWGSSSSAASTTTTSTAVGAVFQSVTSRSNTTASSTVFQASKDKPSTAKTYSVADTASNSVRSALPATPSSLGGVSLPSISNAQTSRGSGSGSSSSAASTTTASTAAGGTFQSVTNRSNMTASSTVFQASKYKSSTASTPVKTGGAAFAKVKAKPRIVRYDVNNEDRQHHSGGEDDDVNLMDSE